MISKIEEPHSDHAHHLKLSGMVAIPSIVQFWNMRHTTVGGELHLQAPSPEQRLLFARFVVVLPDPTTGQTCETVPRSDHVHSPRTCGKLQSEPPRDRQSSLLRYTNTGTRGGRDRQDKEWVPGMNAERGIEP